MAWTANNPWCYQQNDLWSDYTPVVGATPAPALRLPLILR